jgi:hypothetical protein
MVLNPTYLAQRTRSCMYFWFLSVVNSSQLEYDPGWRWLCAGAAAVNWQDAKRRVLKSYREWLRAVSWSSAILEVACISSTLAGTLQLPSPPSATLLLILLESFHTTKVIYQPEANVMVLCFIPYYPSHPRSNLCILLAFPSPRSAQRSDRISNAIDMWTSWTLWMCYCFRAIPSIRYLKLQFP